MNTVTRHIDTLNTSLSELDGLFRDQPQELASILSELLGLTTAQRIIQRATEVVQWLADRLNELTDGAEILDVLSALAEVVLDMFRLFKEGFNSTNQEIPGLSELATILPPGDSLDQVQNALEWFPDPLVLQSIQQHVGALVDSPNGGLHQVMQYLESIHNT